MYYNKAGEQRPRPLKVILGSTEQAKVLMDATDIRVGSDNPLFFSKGLSPQRKTEDERPSNRAFTASKKGEKNT